MARKATPLSPRMMQRYKFFAKHAGGIVGERAKGALDLARAEAHALDRGWDYAFIPEEERYEDVYGEPDPGGEWVTVVLNDEDGNVLGSLGFVDARDSNYLRVVKAELASDAMASGNPSNLFRTPGTWIDGAFGQSHAVIAMRGLLKQAARWGSERAEKLLAEEDEGLGEEFVSEWLDDATDALADVTAARMVWEWDAGDLILREASRRNPPSRKARKYIGRKIRKLAREGMRAPQRIAAAYSMARRKGYKVPKRNPPVRSLPRGYDELDAFLGTKDERKLAHNTLVFRGGGEHEGSIGVKLHNTVIARFWPTGRVILDTGGWSTTTTKSRMSNVLPLPWNVSSYKGTWWVTYRGVKHRPFVGDRVEFAVDKTFDTNPRRRRRSLVPRTKAGQRKHRERLQRLDRDRRRRRMRRNPLVTFGANPNGHGSARHVQTLGKVVEIGYRRTVEPGKGKLFKHEFEHPMNLTALTDGTLVVWHPTIPAWAREGE